MSKRKLLLADDSITIQKVVNLTFADEGIEVFTVGDGDSAMEKLNEFSPDLIMADVNMPGLNGYQICEKIKQDEKLRHTPVILLVGSFEPFDEAEAKRVGADDFLTKPFQSIRQLVNKVTGLLNAMDGKILENKAEQSFAETLEMPKVVEENTTKFDDTEFDDEMIQTNQVGGFAYDEVQKFETKEAAVAEEPDYAKTQSFTVEDVKEFAFSTPEIVNEEVISDESENISATEENFDGEKINEPSTESVEEEIPAPTEAKTEELPLPASATILDLDDDFLELPPIEGEEADEEEEEVSTPIEAAPSENLISEPVEQETVAEEFVVEEPITPTVTTNLSEFSPELIDAIAQRVIEKLSDKAVREIAWEVVPQQADLIIKKMVEEKLKE